MPRWVRVADVSQCPPGGAIECTIEERVVALFNLGGAFYALDGICPHQGGPLGQGCLTEAIVTCPWHGWQFDVRTGQHQLSKAIRQPTFATRVEGDAVWIDLEGS